MSAEAKSTEALCNIIEVLLLSNQETLSLDKLHQIINLELPVDRQGIVDAITTLQELYTERGIELIVAKHGYRIRTRQQYAKWVQYLLRVRPPRYSRATLETLAIIAYRQPVTRADIEQIRGVSASSEIIRTLLDREWIRRAGQKEVPGRPYLYTTTPQFLDYFNLQSIADLPALPARESDV